MVSEMAAVRLFNGFEPFGILGGGAVEQLDVVPVGFFGIERPCDIDNVYVEFVEDGVVRLSELLDGVVNTCGCVGDSEVFFEIIVCYC